MKIQDQQPRTAAEIGVGGTNGAARAEAQASPAAADEKAAKGSAGPAATVELSSRSRELHGALAAVRDSADVRMEKVEEARRKLESGTYVIDPTRIARGLLDSLA